MELSPKISLRFEHETRVGFIKGRRFHRERARDAGIGRSDVAGGGPIRGGSP